MNLFKRAASAAVALVALCSVAFGAGTIPLSGTQQFNSAGQPLAGGLLYTFVSGTTTPQTAYQDQGLTIPFSNPMTLDAAGRVPFFYLADGNIKIRLTDSTGVAQVAADGLLVIGPSAGGGGGGGVDATTVLATGDVKARYGTGVLSGFVRANGRTIGSATSGATERANADAQALFEFLWTTDANLTVSTGRGASANADWLANKTIALPDMRGRVIAGMDDMGASAASRLTAAGFGTLATVLGASGGTETKTIATAQLPSHSHGPGTLGTGIESADHTHSGTTSVESNDHAHSYTFPSGGSTATGPGGTAVVTGTGVTNTGGVNQQHTHSFSSGGVSATHTHSVTTGATATAGSGTALAVANPAMVMTIYVKL